MRMGWLAGWLVDDDDDDDDYDDAQPGKRDRPKMSVDSVDERIKKLEMKQSTGTMSLKEEKELMQEIKELKKSRAGIADYDSSLETLRAKRETQDMKRSELISILKELDTEIDALTEQRDAAQAEVEALGPVRKMAAWG